MSVSQSIIVTEQDIRRLTEVVSLYGEIEEEGTEALQRELDRAVIVAPAAVGASVVTMNSHVVCRDDRGATREVVIVYPKDADLATGRVSVLAPLGHALLGARVGDRVEIVGRGRSKFWTVEEVRYQPEAAGDYDL